MLCSRTGIGVDRESRRGERPPSHVSTDTFSFAPLNTLTLSGHHSNVDPHYSHLCYCSQMGKEKQEEKKPAEILNTSDRGARLRCWDGHLMGCPVILGMFNYTKVTDLTIQSDRNTWLSENNNWRCWETASQFTSQGLKNEENYLENQQESYFPQVQRVLIVIISKSSSFTH